MPVPLQGNQGERRLVLVLRCASSIGSRSLSAYLPVLFRLQVIGEDISPGIKAGGRINWIRRTIPCLARGDSIPQDFTVDIRC